jgi:FkbM family methyltransferase
MKINFFSNAPWWQTGYGVQCRINVPRMVAAGHEMTITAWTGLQGGVLNWNGIPTFPGYLHLYGQDIAGAHASGSDIMISLLDSWVCEPERYPKKLRWIPWFPIDSEPLMPGVRAKVEQAYHRITMSKFGNRMMNDAGLDYSYVPHGIETNVYTPIDRKEARKKVKFPESAFVIGMVAANKGNPSRKSFQQQLEAFAQFKKKHSDAIMYIHTNTSEHGEYAGVNLPELCKFLGLRENIDVIFPDQYQNILGYPDEWMNNLYNAFDVHTLVSMGEGFGIPIVEAQAAGCPVIVGDWTSMSELCFSGWKVSKSEAEPIWTAGANYQYIPHTSAILEKYEAAYHKKDNQIYRDRARVGALDYDADKVFLEYWVPTLKLIEDKIADDPRKAKENHVHQWSKIGLYDKFGSLSMPCIGCHDEIMTTPDGKGTIVPNGFKPSFDLKFVPDTDGITKIVCREIERDYDLDNLDIKDGDFIIDIGAHKGIVSCYLAWKYPKATILAYEPVMENFMTMNENIVLNKINNIIPYNMAVTKDGRDVFINSDPGNSGGGNIYQVNEGAQVVNSITLQEILKFHGIDKLALLKIDCEGSEFEILDTVLLKQVSCLRGEFHKAAGNTDKLLTTVNKIIPDVKVTVQG